MTFKRFTIAVDSNYHTRLWAYDCKWTATRQTLGHPSNWAGRKWLSISRYYLERTTPRLVLVCETIFRVGRKA